MDLLRASSNFFNIHGAWVLGGLIAAGLIKHKSNQKKQRAESFAAEGGRKYRGIGMKPLDHPDRGTLCDVDGCRRPSTNVRRTFGWVIRFCDQHQEEVDSTYEVEDDEDSLYGAEESDNTTPTPKNPCPRCEGAGGFPKEFYFEPKKIDFIPCRNCIEMGGYCPGCMEVLPGLSRDRDPWEAFDEGCGKCGWSWADATAIRSTTTPWSVHIDHPGAQRWFASEEDAYAYAYTEGHRDSRVGSPYKPLLKKVNRDSFRNVVRQKAEDLWNAEEDHGSVKDTEEGWLVYGYDQYHAGGNAFANYHPIQPVPEQYMIEDLKFHNDDGWAGSGDGIFARSCRLDEVLKCSCHALPDDHPDWMKSMCESCYDSWTLSWKKGGANANLGQSKDDEDDECSVCDGLGWRYVEDDDGDSVRAPCHECGGGSSTGSPTGVVAYDADTYDQSTHGPYLPVGAVKRFLARMPAQEEFFVTFVKSNSDVRDMHCFLTRPYDPDNDVAGVMELGGPRAIFKRFRTDRVISIYR